jgi:hypothetical protein
VYEPAGTVTVDVLSEEVRTVVVFHHAFFATAGGPFTRSAAERMVTLIRNAPVLPAVSVRIPVSQWSPSVTGASSVTVASAPVSAGEAETGVPSKLRLVTDWSVSLAVNEIEVSVVPSGRTLPSAGVEVTIVAAVLSTRTDVRVSEASLP